MCVDTSGACRPAGQDVTPVALKHNLPVVPDLPDVGLVLVKANGAKQQDLAILNKAREGAEN